MFESVLIANRGEIALRVSRTLRRLGIESIAVFSDADAESPHVYAADRAIRIGPAPAAESYLNIERILDAARSTGAQAVHPGYGFLSERADFAVACQQAGLAFVGPSAEAIALLGDKAAAKKAAAAAGVPVVPGLAAESLSDRQMVEWAKDQPLPLLLKAAGGGGGRGMRVVNSLQELPDEIAAARREAHAAFGDRRLIVERLIEQARHIEVQVIADAHGSVLHLGERECSLQRRHQKVIEESPSPVVTPQLRQQLGQAAVALARGCGYTGAGTVELIAARDDPKSFYFMEMNARLQVEHPVTEAVTGLDLVELQLRVAAGEPLALTQEDIHLRGHAIEARIYAEDPTNGFMPSAGRIAIYREPPEAVRGGARAGSAASGSPAGDSAAAAGALAGAAAPALRFDSGVQQGTEVSTHYDPMLAKAISHGPDRASALARLERALKQTRILGPTTNLPWLIALLQRAEVRAGTLDTTLLQRIGGELGCPPQDQQTLAGLALVAILSGPHSDDPWDVKDGWSLLGRQQARRSLRSLDGEVEAIATPAADGSWGVGSTRVHAQSPGHSDEWRLTVEQPNGVVRVIDAYRDGEAIWLVEQGVPLRFGPPSQRRTKQEGVDSLQAPMPGVVLEVRTAVGSEVGEGEVLIVIESMKMEMSLASPEHGVVKTVHVAAGDRVSQGQALLEMEAS